MDHITNTSSFTSTSTDPLFYLCWRRQSCNTCLKGDVPCSWCAVSSTCVPNPSLLPILSPLHSSQICPLGSKERWELRAIPFGCHVSTTTFLTGVVGVLGTLAVLGLIALGVWVGRGVRRRGGWKGLPVVFGNGNWVGVVFSRWGGRRGRDGEDEEGAGGGRRAGDGGEDERRPLLGGG
ncbi:metallopeptidase Mip1 [Aspergillus tubingensis]|uniref:metallopeptidase Mip1 n=1 Tax=Aspergillus tubingensis TaxID=5068 RepID=UPI0015781B96|nr:metallopeptidase Mip1 [Aspergillus tubingensis]GFN19017.1 metallopeptidase Mip1 [Aspergillus tubingensis]